jgi:hypothetical protein
VVRDPTGTRSDCRGGARGSADVRFPAHYGLNSDIAPCLKSANSGLMHRSNLRAYSITSSARPSSVAGMSMPSALAVFRLIASSNLVGSWTGRSAGLAPLRMRSI